MVLGYGDSHVAPKTIFDAGPGEMFVVRNIAAVVPPCEPDTETAYHGTSAAIQFGVNALDVGHLVVLGHASCGGVDAYANKAAPLSHRDFIGKCTSQLPTGTELLGPHGGHRHPKTPH